MPSFRKTQPYTSPSPGGSLPPGAQGAPGDALAQTPLPAELDPTRARPPAGRRTVQLAPGKQATLPADAAPGWMQRARHMANALEGAIEAGQVPPSTEAAIERAWAAWELNGVSDRQVAKVAHLTARAHHAMHGASRTRLEKRIIDCALVLHRGLPAALRRRVPLELVVEVVRELHRERDPWPAIVQSTALLLGWVAASQAHAAQAVRIALEQRSSRQS
jgi:hypothetical protein